MMEFSKKLLLLDYLVFLILVVFSIIFKEVDLTTVTVAWIAQLGISSSAYYWKAKNENRFKVPFKIIRSLPIKLMDQLDMTQVLVAMIQSSE